MSEAQTDTVTADKKEPMPDYAKEVEDLKAKLAAYEAKPKEDPNLVDKVRKQNADDADSASKLKKIESAIAFNMKSGEFVKANAGLLPKEIEDIFKAADKETYNDHTEKASALKSSVIQSFFSLQANVDLLTGHQKAILDDYLKLTKTGKQEKAQETYDTIFEPAFEMLKRIKRAEALNKGHALGGNSDAETEYKNRLMQGSLKHYGLEKK